MNAGLIHAAPPNDQASRLRTMVMGLSAPDHAPIAGAPAHPRLCPLVAITSGKGGVGKTSLCVNLAIALARSLRVTLLDADLGMANADVMCGLMPTRRLEDAVASRGARPLSHIAIDAPGGFQLVPGSVGVAQMAALTPAQRQGILAALSEVEARSDIVLIDTGAGLSPGVTGFVEAADLAIVIATPEPTSIADAYAMIKCTAPNMPRGRIRLVINQALSHAEAVNVHRRISEVAKRFLGFEIPLLGWVPSDDAVPQAVRARRPLLLRTPNANSAIRVRALSEDLAHALSIKARRHGLARGKWLASVFGRALSGL